MNIQSFIGKSNSEADRKRLYREKIEEQKQLLGQKSEKSPTDDGTSSEIKVDKCPIDSGTNGGTLSDKRPPEKEIEIEQDIEIKSETDINKELAIDVEADNRSKANIIHSQSVCLLNNFEKETVLSERINLDAVKKAVEQHGLENVKKSIAIAISRGKPTMIYINGILKNWAIEGYPKEGEENGNGRTPKFNGSGSNEFAGFKPMEPRTIREEERAAMEVCLNVIIRRRNY